MGKRWALLLVIAYIVALTVVSLINIGGVPELGSSFDDKIYHFIAYALFTLLYYHYLLKTKINRKILVTILVVVSYGVLMEVLQNVLTDDRVSDPFDVMANFFGVVFAVILISIYMRLKLK